MRIKLSRDLSSQFSSASDWRYQLIEQTAKLARASATVKWAKADPSRIDGHQVRFTLDGASVQQHDTFFAAIYMLDPDAIIETARATYECAQDFAYQRAGRVD